MSQVENTVEQPDIDVRSQHLNRNDVIKIIKDNLQRRSGKSWSVTGGRGTAYGWLRIDAPPARRLFKSDGVTKESGEFGYSSLEDRNELAKLLGLNSPVHCQGVSIAASSDYYQEYIERAQGKQPKKIAQPYWD